jgi:hypothetical protein
LKSKQDTISAFAFGEAFGGVEAARDVLLSHSKGTEDNIAEGVFGFQRPFVPMHDAVRVLFDVGISCPVLAILIAQ